VQFVKEQLTFTGEDTAMATLLLSVMGAFAEFERSLIRERQREGIALARARSSPRSACPLALWGRTQAHARRLLEQVDGIRAHVLAATETTTVTIGVLTDSADQAGMRLAVEFRRRHPHVNVRIREADLADPSTGLRAGLVDIALTRAPFDQTGISVHVVRAARARHARSPPIRCSRDLW